MNAMDDELNMLMNRIRLNGIIKIIIGDKSHVNGSLNHDIIYDIAI